MRYLWVGLLRPNLVHGAEQFDQLSPDRCVWLERQVGQFPSNPLSRRSESQLSEVLLEHRELRTLDADMRMVLAVLAAPVADAIARVLDGRLPRVPHRAVLVLEEPVCPVGRN